VSESRSATDVNEVHDRNALSPTWVSVLGSSTNVSEVHLQNANLSTWVMDRGRTTSFRTVQEQNAPIENVMRLVADVRDKCVDEVHQIRLARTL
jgi:hypothetical protein